MKNDVAYVVILNHRHGSTAFDCGSKVRHKSMLFVGNNQTQQPRDGQCFLLNLTLVISLLLSSGCYSRTARQDKEIKTVQNQSAPNKLVTIEGTAQNAKLSAVVVGPESVVYCLNIPEWPSHIVGKRVRIKGVLETTDEFAAKTNSRGEITQGSAGGDLVMRQCEYQLID